MLELSLHILDIANNSVKAEASLIEISVEENVSKNFLRISIKDDGCGMDKEFLAQVTDPFKTTRTTRKVGMGLSLFKAAAENTGGGLEIKSEKGVGTEVVVTFVYDHIDRQPLGDIGETLTTLISGNASVDFVYKHSVNDKEFLLDTRNIREILGGDISLGSPEIVIWMKDYIKEGLSEISI
ncbi:MAG: ATP-binding protein [Clostridia bacterium]|nr:ATP-binding protein [Clostridia bacterium]